MSAKPRMRRHGSLEIHSISNNALTEIRPIQSLIRQPDLEPASILVLVEFRYSETRSVDRDAVPNMTVP